MKVEPQVEAPANGISTCVKGKFGWDFVNSKERLTKPLIREGDTFREADWEEALHLIKRKFTETKKCTDRILLLLSVHLSVRTRNLI